MQMKTKGASAPMKEKRDLASTKTHVVGKLCTGGGEGGR